LKKYRKNIRHLKNEYEKKEKSILNEKIIEEYKRIYLLRVADHAKNGTIILMKNLMNEDFIFKDIISYLENSRKIKLYINKLEQNFNFTSHTSISFIIKGSRFSLILVFFKLNNN